MHIAAKLYSASNITTFVNISEKQMFIAGVQQLSDALPRGWLVDEVEVDASRRGYDGVVDIRAPDGRIARIYVEVKARLEPREAQQLVDRVARMPPAAWLIVSRYLGPAARSMLAEAAIGYLDLTGNLELQISEPGLFVARTGDDRDPMPITRSVSSLRGAKAARIVRDLIEQISPGTVRDIAARTGTDPGHVSRVLSFLDEQALVSRSPRGQLERVDWPALLRRWATDAPVASRARVSTFLDPRGLSSLLDKLASFQDPYAITGSLAASRVAPIASPRLAKLHVHDAVAIASALGLRPTDAGANVMLFEADDDLPLEPGPRTPWGSAAANDPRDLRYAAVVQVAADLLTGPGREPAEGEALIAWMVEHEEAWRG